MSARVRELQGAAPPDRGDPQQLLGPGMEPKAALLAKEAVARPGPEGHARHALIQCPVGHLEVETALLHELQARAPAAPTALENLLRLQGETRRCSRCPEQAVVSFHILSSPQRGFVIRLEQSDIPVLVPLLLHAGSYLDEEVVDAGLYHLVAIGLTGGALLERDEELDVTISSWTLLEQRNRTPATGFSEESDTGVQITAGRFCVYARVLQQEQVRKYQRYHRRRAKASKALRSLEHHRTVHEFAPPNPSPSPSPPSSSPERHPYCGFLA